MQQSATSPSTWTMTGELDCQPEDETSAAGVTVCRLRLVSYTEGEKPTRAVLYTSGQLAERCRDGLGEGDLIEASGALADPQRPGASHPEVLVPDLAAAIRLRRRASEIAAAERVVSPRPSERRRIVHCLNDDYDVYIGRGRDPHSRQLGNWGNRYSHRPSRVPGVIEVRTAEEAVRLFRRDLWAWLKDGRTDKLKALAALDGKTLGCWHEDPTDAWRAEFTEGPRGDREPCHGHVLIEAAAWAKGQLEGRAG